MQILSQNSKISQPTCATIGAFDGVHLGHRFLLGNLQKAAFSSGLKPLVITFKNHPHNFFNPNNNFKLLTPENEKLELLAEINPDFTLLLDFNKEISAMKSADFLLFLQKNFSLKKLLIGYNHSFGSDKIRDFDEYKKIGENLGIEIEQCPPFYLNENQQVSSSNIRELLLGGEVEKANALLGRNYSLAGMVQAGEKIGRTIGFPTANLAVSPQKLVPMSGVYSVEVMHKNRQFIGMLYIGNRPTLTGKNQTIEVNIFDFDEDIYSQKIEVFFKKFIREDKKFSNLAELKNQIEKDKKVILQD